MKKYANKYLEMKDDEDRRRLNEGKPLVVRAEHPGELRKNLLLAEKACQEAINFLDDLWTRGIQQKGGKD